MLTIKPTKEQRKIPALRDMILDYLADGGTPVRYSDGTVGYPLDTNGESEFSQGEYEALAGAGVKIDGGIFWIELNSTMMNNLVDVDLPDSKYIDSEGVEQRRRYNEYFRFNQESVTIDKHLIRLVHFPYSAVYDPDDPAAVKGGAFGLTDENRKTFEKELGVTAMVKSVGLRLQPVTVVEGV
jgi:hypothetical protein